MATFRRIQEQIHCLLSPVDKPYERLTTWKPKKELLRAIIGKSSSHRKDLCKKLVKDTTYVETFEERHGFW